MKKKNPDTSKIVESVTFIKMIKRPAKTKPQQDTKEPTTIDNIYRPIVLFFDVAFVLNCDQSAFDKAAEI